MVRCSGVKKADCAPPCEWIPGKGCAKAKKTPSPPPKKSPTNRRYAFMGFKDDVLKAAVESMDNKVTYGLKSDSTHIVYKKDKRIADKIEQSGLSKMLVSEFVARYAFPTKKADAPAPAKPPSPAKAPAAAKASKKPKKEASPVNKITVMKGYYYGAEPKGPDYSRYSNYYVLYGEVRLRKVFKQAKAVTLNMFKDENDIRGVVDDGFFYVPSRDLFVIALKARVDSDRKNQNLNTVYGVEFTYDDARKYKIKVDANAMVLLEEHSAPPEKLLLDIRKAIKDEYDDVYYLSTN